MMIEEKEIHLRDYLRIINKRKITVFTIFLIVATVAIIKTFTQTPMYRAATRVMIEKNTTSILNNYRYSSWDPEFLETQYQLIKSAAVAEKVVKQIGAEKMYDIFFGKPDTGEKTPSLIRSVAAWIKQQMGNIKSLFGISRLLAPDPVDQDLIPPELDVPLSKTEQMVAAIKGGIMAEPVGTSRVVEISFWSTNPVIAMQVVNSVADAYISELLDMQMQVTGYSISWMRDKAEIQRQKLEESEKELHDYKRKHDIITVEDRLAVLPQRLAEFSTKLALAEAKRKELAAIYEQVKNVQKEKLETIPGIVENAAVDGVNEKILLAEQKISELSKKYGPKHPRMITARTELDSLLAKKYQELEKAVQTIRNEYELARSNENSIRELLDETKFQTERLGERSIQLNILQRKVDTNRYLYDALIKKMKEEGITEKNQSVNVWVIEKATLPAFPAKPDKRRGVLMGIVIGLFAGIGLAFFFEYLDNTIKTPEDVEEKFDVPVIGTIDLFTRKNISLFQDVLANPSAINAENFRGLRTSVLLSSADNPPKIVLTTSMTPGEGKSSVSACLALSIAQAGKKVLLVDADMRRPVQHKNFNLPNAYGLSSVLAGISRKDDQQIFHHPVKQLDVLTAGPIPPNPAELLSGQRLHNLFEQFIKKYDMVIVDTPPIASVTDPLILSQHVDGVIVVTWAGKTTYDIFRKGLKQLTEISAPVTGIVLNRFNAKKSGYYYNYGDYYYSSDGS